MTYAAALQLAGIVLLAGVISLLVLWIAGRFLLHSHAPHSCGPGTQGQCCFLFAGNVLSDHDIAPGQLCSAAVQRLQAWDDLRNWLGGRFGPLPPDLTQLPGGFLKTFPALNPEDSAELTITSLALTTRITLSDTECLGPADLHEATNMHQTLADRDWALQHSPCMICATTHQGRILWHNKAFSSLPQDQQNILLGTADDRTATDGAATRRVSVDDEKSGRNRWYEVQTTLKDDLVMHFASNISPVIQAETAQREFVQTLTKTFANLTIGLAVFDRNRQLALFNPALLDLTNLPVDFLSARPQMMSFFDMLRDRQIMPEPKNYAHWRNQVNEMIETASGGLYLETWSLSSGLTYRVTGRPHPDGAMAFLFEDISDEISLTRRFRAQLEIRQSVLDKLDDAVAVIAANKVLMFCNDACANMLGIDPDSSFADMSVRDLFSACEAKFPGHGFWQGAETAILNSSPGKASHRALRLGHDHRLHCHMSPLTGGAMMLRLSQPQTESHKSTVSA